MANGILIQGGPVTAYGAATDKEHGGTFEGTYDEFCESLSRVMDLAETDEEPIENSPHPVTSGGLYNIIHKTDGATELVGNVVAGGKITAGAIASSEMDVITKGQFDSETEAIQDSINEVVEAVDEKISKVDEQLEFFGVKNLLPKASGSIKKSSPGSNNISYTVYENGRILIDSSSGYTANLVIARLKIPSGYYKLMEINNKENLVAKGISNEEVELCTALNTPFYYDSSLYSELQVSVFRNQDSTRAAFTLDIYPALVLASNDDEIDYSSYSIPNRNMTQNFYSNNANNMVGAKNLLPSLPEGTQTVNGVTFKINSDGSITANGTTSESEASLTLPNFYLLKGDYILSGVPANSGCTIKLFTKQGPGPSYNFNFVTADENGFIFNTPYSNEIYGKITIPVGIAEVNNLTFYPMLRNKYNEDATYTPYTMTNRQLTNALSYNSNTIDISGYFIDGKAIHRRTFDLGNLSAYGLNYDGTEQTINVTDASFYTMLTTHVGMIINCTLISKVYHYYTTTVGISEDYYLFSGNAYIDNERKINSYYRSHPINSYDYDYFINIGSAFTSSQAASHNQFYLILEYTQ